MPPSVAAILTEALQHHRAGHLPDAERLYRQVLATEPHHADALHLLGMIAQQTARPDLAAQAYRAAIAASPATPHFHFSLGNLLGEQFRLDQALTCFDHAIALKPDFAEAHNSRGTALARLGRPQDAIAAFTQAVAHKPGFADAHNNLGNALFAQGRLEQAATCFQQAIALRPEYPGAHNNLGNIRKEQGRIPEALTHYDQAVALDPANFHAHSNRLFCQNYLPNQSPETLRDNARRFGERVTRQAPAVTPGPPSARPLRVGIVSGDLRAHPVGFFLEALLRASDSTRITFHAFPTHPAEDHQTARLKPHFAAWHPIHTLSDPAAAALIRDSAPHILLDLSGHTANNRLPLFAHRPAPIQASWLGYFATTGVAEVDYILADPHVAPPEEAHHFTETIWRLPETYLCFTPPDPPVPIPPRPNGPITFGCFNNATKLNDHVVAVWSRILHAVPDSRLILKAAQFNDSAVRASLQARFAAHAIPSGRLRIDPPSSRTDYLRAYHQIDIALDPFPYPGGTTSVEALWMGVPVLTRRGDRFLSHLGETILHNAGLPDWIAADDSDLIAKAVRYAADPAALATLRTTLRAQVLASPLFDAPRFALHFQHAMTGMWARHLFTQALHHHQAGRPAEAEPLYRQSLTDNPNQPDALHLLGLIAQGNGDLDLAAETILRAITRSPRTGHYHCSLGTVRADQGRLDDALSSFDQAVALTPSLPEAHFNRGSTLSQLVRTSDAIACYRQAIALRPDFADAHHNLAMALLSQGDWSAGWPEYEWRWKTHHMRPDLRAFPQPVWRGEDAPGRTLLIQVEQGFGDTIQFCRFAPLIAARGLRVILEVQPPLQRLLSTLPNVQQVVARGDPLPPFDYVCPMLSLPLAFGTTVATVPNTTPYIHADPNLVRTVARRLSHTAGTRIGLAWAGSGALKADSRRSIAPQRLRPLAALPGFTFISLQKAGPPPPADLALLDLMDQMTDFADTAALIANLDLVITVDTAVVHLAGAMGKPVWLLNRFDTCWRWMDHGDRSPWYPTLRIYRQPHPGDWDTVLSQVAHDLTNAGDRY